MSKRHKWYREICAWADGLEVQARYVDRNHNDDWQTFGFDGIEVEDWNDANFEFRIKPQPKEPQYLYALELASGIVFGKSPSLQHDKDYIGKIKLEVEDD